ncbi:hypothetical protein Rsub_03177 [Raphidocelis subcapitata]|uniref:Rhamnogalacturonase A/B/Epimerase-like pectate lyase domain-containing protein n=1 Tax=Raphidocelis subcapitata TaxID=307507 RepID=A0A2V0P0J2_9CHLO|nr:hypothetical protein Rsub_03177 [Raphidocelis subcapitata]|eukprot:GBF90605.1 hypothetical protein Rsub_03177 [Raphidocelis subcapitata]
MGRPWRTREVFMVALAALVAGAEAQLNYACLRSNGAKCCLPGATWTGCVACPADAVRPSNLYGCAGEAFNRANSRLMDWSHAGYMYGDYDPPAMPVMADIKAAFGAKGDGVSDDTAAFELAISTIARKGTLLLPKGTYVITRRLDIDKQVCGRGLSDHWAFATGAAIFFQGVGAGQTVIYFPKSLSQIYSNTWPNGHSQAREPYAFGPGFINWNGGDFPNANTHLAYVTADAKRGQDTIQVDTLQGLEVGKVVRIVLDNVNNDMLASFNQRLFPPFEPYANRADVVKFTSKIVGVLTNPLRRAIKLERVLPYDVPLLWKPEIHDWNNEAYGVKRNMTGMADLTVRFPSVSAYEGESKEAGYNGLYMFHTAHSWVRNVVFENADIGIIMDGASFNTIQNVTFNSARPKHALHPYYGGKGIWLKGTYDCLVRSFFFNTRFRYEIATSYFAVGNVFADGSGVDLTLEFMYAAAYSNLYTNINMGAASEPFGWTVRGQDLSGLNTFWNLRTASNVLVLPPYTWGPAVNWIDVEGAVPPATGNPMNWYFETRTPVWPFNLWATQRSVRKRPLTLPAPVRYSGPGYNCWANGTKCCATAATGCPACGADPSRTPSKLFGCQGELWRATERLGYEWSYAGYKEGKTWIPWIPQVANLKTQFGAKGDGVTDDTAALLKALDSVQSGAIFLPAGTYVIQSVINWRKPIVLRGEGKDKTFLKFPKSLTDLYNNTWVEGKWVGTSQYSHGTGFINIGGWDPTGRSFSKITWVKLPAAAGDRVLRLGCCMDKLAVGQMVRLWMSDPGDGSLMAELHGNKTSVAPEFFGYADPVRFLSRIIAVGADWIKLERPLPVRVDPKFMPMIDGSAGVEHLTVQFPFTAYPGHFKARRPALRAPRLPMMTASAPDELGWNGIHLNQVSNGWVRHVRIENGDMGVYFWGTVFCTIEGVDLVSTPSQRGWFNGHRGVFKINTRFIHDVSVSGTEHGSVFMDGYGFDLNLDHHRSAPYANMYTNLDVGLGSRVFEASGDVTWGTHTARFSTFHNFRSRLSFLLPDDEFGPQMTFLGLPTADTADPRPQDWWVELLRYPEPQNLYNTYRTTAKNRLANL